MSCRHLAVLALVSCVAAFVSPAVDPVAAAPVELEPQAADVGFESINPARLLDTRADGITIDGAFARSGAVPAGGHIDLTVLGRGGVPSTGIDTVVLNVTATEPTEVGFVTVWPTGEARPNASNLNFVPGRTVPNLVVAKVGAGGQVSLFNFAGRTHIIADVVAFAKSTAVTSLVPARLLDTRADGVTVDGAHARGGAFGTTGERALPVLGRGGVPASGVDAVVVNVTAIGPTDGGFLTVWPNGEARPNASNLNFVPGDTVPNLVVAKVGAGGAIGIFNSLGSTNIVVDVVGYSTTASALDALVPARLLETRPGTSTVDGQAAGTGPLGAGQASSLLVTGRGGVPSSDVGTVFLNVTVVRPSEAGFLTVWPDGEARPNASSLNFVPGQTVANLVAASVGANGRVAFFNSAGRTDLVVDVIGWVATSDYLDFLTYEAPPGVVGAPYSHTIVGRGGDSPYTFGATGLQPGISAAAGVLSGTPTTAGTVSSTMSVTDALGRTNTRDVNHTVFPAGSGYTSVTPTTVLDLVEPPSNADTVFTVGGVAGVPADAEAVVLMVFVASLVPGYATVYPAGQVRPGMSSSNFAPGLDTNLEVVRLGTGGQVRLYNSSTPVGIVVQVMGYFANGSSYTPVLPSRVLDTRSAPPAVGAGGQRTAALGSLAPPTATAAMVHIITTETSAAGTATAFAGATPPANPALRWRQSSVTTLRTALVPLDGSGNLTVRVDGSSAHVIVDLIGYIDTIVT